MHRYNSDSDDDLMQKEYVSNSNEANRISRWDKVLIKERLIGDQRPGYIHRLGHIQGTNSIAELYKIYKSKEVQTALREHLDNVIFSFGDTDSYKAVVSKLADQVIMLTPATVAECNMKNEILNEEVRLTWRFIDRDNHKHRAKALLKSELEAALASDDWDKFMALFEEVKKEKGIFCYLRKNILFNYGHPNSYKEALFLIGTTACRFKLTKENHKQRFIGCCQIHETIKNIQSKHVTSEWYDMANRLAEFAKQTIKEIYGKDFYVGTVDLKN